MGFIGFRESGRLQGRCEGVIGMYGLGAGGLVEGQRPCKDHGCT